MSNEHEDWKSILLILRCAYLHDDDFGELIASKCETDVEYRNLLELRSAYYDDGDFIRHSVESRYKADLESHNHLLEEMDFFIAPKREHADTCHNVFEALAGYLSIGAPIPPELNETILYLYEGVYLRNKGKVSLEKTFFNQSGKQVFARQMKERKDNWDAAMIRTGVQFEGKTKLEVATEIADERERRTGQDVDPESILRVIRRKKLLD